MQHNRIIPQEEWFAAHAQHLVKEKELTRLRDQLSAARRALPWVRVEKTYSTSSSRQSPMLSKSWGQAGARSTTTA